MEFSIQIEVTGSCAIGGRNIFFIFDCSHEAMKRVSDDIPIPRLHLFKSIIGNAVQQLGSTDNICAISFGRSSKTRFPLSPVGRVGDQVAHVIGRDSISGDIGASPQALMDALNSYPRGAPGLIVYFGCEEREFRHPSGPIETELCDALSVLGATIIAFGAGERFDPTATSLKCVTHKLPDDSYPIFRLTDTVHIPGWGLTLRAG
jgi:hypothetical protein